MMQGFTNSKISYKTYFNERLKKVSFHGVTTYPLYIQVTFERRTIFFKSYYFELLSHGKYARIGGRRKYPSIQQVIDKENELIEFIVSKMVADFSLEEFKRHYNYYCRDLCQAMEQKFRDYIYTFFADKGMPRLASVIQRGSIEQPLFGIVEDLKIALKKPLFLELLGNSQYYAPPYLLVFEFVALHTKGNLASISVKDWSDLDIQNAFEAFLTAKHADLARAQVIKQVNDSLGSLY